MNTPQKEIDVELLVLTAIRAKERKTLFIEFVIYMVFLALTLNYCLFSSFITTGDQYWLNRGLKYETMLREDPDQHLEKTFVNMGQVAEFWGWYKYGLTRLFQDIDFVTLKPYPPNLRRYVAGYNKLIGSLRIRQVRVKNDTCNNMLPTYGVSFNKRFPYGNSKDFPNYCAGEFDYNNPDMISKEPFGTDNIYTYKTCDEMGGGNAYTGWKTSYPCDGHVVTIPFTTSYLDAFDNLTSLQKNYFVDHQTRFIMAEYFVYNGNLNYFVSIKNAVEFTAGGSVIPSWQYTVFKLEVLRTTTDYISFAFCLFLPVFLCYYIYKWFFGIYLAYIEAKSKAIIWYQSIPFHYFVDLWSMIDFVKSVLFVISFICRLVWWSDPKRLNYVISDLSYPQLDTIVTIWTIDTYVCGINAGIVVFRTFRFFELSEDSNLLIRTIYMGFGKLIGTGFVLFYVIFAFAWAYLMIYGTQMDIFRSVELTFVSLFRSLLGDIPYDDLKWANYGWTPIIHPIFGLIGIFIVLNMFLAVIKDIFTTVSEEESIGTQPVTLELLTYAKDKIKKGFSKIYNSELGDEKLDGILKKNFERNNSFEQGDKRLINILSQFKNQHEGQDLTLAELKRAIGKGASYDLLARTMKRLNPEGDGIINVQELTEEILHENYLKKSFNNEEKQLLYSEAKQFQKDSTHIKKGESLKSLGIQNEEEPEEIPEEELSQKIDSLLFKCQQISKLLSKKN